MSTCVLVRAANQIELLKIMAIEHTTINGRLITLYLAWQLDGNFKDNRIGRINLNSMTWCKVLEHTRSIGVIVITIERTSSVSTSRMSSVATQMILLHVTRRKFNYSIQIPNTLENQLLAYFSMRNPHCNFFSGQTFPRTGRMPNLEHQYHSFPHQCLPIFKNLRCWEAPKCSNAGSVPPTFGNPCYLAYSVQLRVSFLRYN